MTPEELDELEQLACPDGDNTLNAKTIRALIRCVRELDADYRRVVEDWHAETADTAGGPDIADLRRIGLPL